jgi:DNA-binding NtrC family response regulator
MRYWYFKTHAQHGGIAMTSLSAHGSPETANVNGLRVLLVEDSWELGTAMTRLLRAWGVDVIGLVATRADAKRAISERPCDIAVVDLNLRGGEKANRLIDDLHAQGIRVVLTTGYAEVPLAPGTVSASLQKPVKAAQLLAALRP